MLTKILTGPLCQVTPRCFRCALVVGEEGQHVFQVTEHLVRVQGACEREPHREQLLHRLVGHLGSEELGGDAMAEEWDGMAAYHRDGDGFA
jgi:hypothetical protein